MTEDKRARILDAAIAVFCEEGLESASIARIAERAEVAKGTIYLYFSSKDELVEQAFWQCHENDVAACQQGLDALPDAIEKLLRRLRNVTRWALENPNEIMMERLYYASPRYGRHARYQNQKLQFMTVDKIMRDGLARRELKPLPAETLGEIFFGIGAAILNHLTEAPEKLEDCAFWTTCDELISDCLSSCWMGRASEMPKAHFGDTPKFPQGGRVTHISQADRIKT